MVVIPPSDSGPAIRSRASVADLLRATFSMIDKIGVEIIMVGGG